MSAAFGGKLSAKKAIVTDDIGEIMEIGDWERAEEYALSTGRAIVEVADVWIDMDNADNYTCSGCSVHDGDTLLRYFEIRLSDQTPEMAHLFANAEILDGSALTIPFSLEKAQITVQALKPDNASGNGVTVLSASLSQTPFADYLRLVYKTSQTSYGQIAKVFAADATYYMTGHGTYAHTDPECSGMANAEAVTCQEVIAAKKLPCPVFAGGDMALVAGSEAWTVEFWDEEGKPVKIAGTSSSEAAGSIADGAFSKLIIIQSGSLSTGNLFVRFTAPDSEVFPVIKLE